MCSKIGLEIEESDTLSDRVCHACARKIRNGFELYNFIYSSLQKEKAIEVSGASSRCKRLLPTTVSSPDRSPQTRKGHKASRENSASKKSLKFGELPPPSSTTNNITSNTLEEIQEITPGEIAFSHMNVEELLESSATEAKVVIVNPNRNVETFSSFDNKTKSMIANLCRKRWKTAANLAFAIPEMREELADPLRRTIAREFQEYCNNTTDSVLKKSRPDDLVSFTNKLLVHEAGVWCPFWMTCVKGACNVRKSSELDYQENKFGGPDDIDCC